MVRRDVIYMLAMSLDGFIARPDGAVDWLDAFPADADYDFDAFLGSLAGIVMGRGSYEAARRSGGWDYGRWPVAVATTRPLADAPAGVEAVGGGPKALLDNVAGRSGEGRIWMFGGGELARQFIEADLLDTIEIGTIPVLLGSGIPVVAALGRDVWLDLNFARPLANGAVHSQYSVRRA